MVHQGFHGAGGLGEEELADVTSSISSLPSSMT
jgi:hypothetical protein